MHPVCLWPGYMLHITAPLAAAAAVCLPHCTFASPALCCLFRHPPPPTHTHMSICLSPPQRQSQLQQQLAGVEEELAQASSVIADKQGAREPLVAAVAANDAAVKQLRQEMAAAHHQ